MASVFARAAVGFRNAPVGLRPAKPFAPRFFRLAAIDKEKLRVRAEQITQLAASNRLSKWLATKLFIA